MSVKYPCDMHCHTTRSDGNDSPQELIDNAAEKGMKAIGLVDHDIVPPEFIDVDGKQVNAVAYAADKGIRLIPGYEFSCDTQVDDVHICGYNMDWTHPDLAEEMKACEDSKVNAYADLCTLLTQNDMPIDWEKDILNYIDVDGNPATRKPEDVQRKHIFETIAAKGYTPTWSDAKIMVRDTPDLSVKRRKIDPKEAIAMIHRAGGIAILAHPYLIDENIDEKGCKCTRDQYIDELIDAGLDGIEASYTYNKTSYKGTMTPEEVEKDVRAKYQNRLKYISGGSDYHADHKKGSKKVREMGERGLTLEEFEAIFPE